MLMVKVLVMHIRDEVVWLCDQLGEEDLQSRFLFWTRLAPWLGHAIRAQAKSSFRSGLGTLCASLLRSFICCWLIGIRHWC